VESAQVFRAYFPAQVAEGALNQGKIGRGGVVPGGLPQLGVGRAFGAARQAG